MATTTMVPAPSCLFLPYSSSLLKISVIYRAVFLEEAKSRSGWRIGESCAAVVLSAEAVFSGTIPIIFSACIP